MNQIWPPIKNAWTLLQVRSQVLTFGGENLFLGGKILVFMICLKQIFLGTTNFGGAQNIVWALFPNARSRFAGVSVVSNSTLIKALEMLYS